MAAYLYFFVLLRSFWTVLSYIKIHSSLCPPAFEKDTWGGGGEEGEKQFEDRPAVVSFSKI